jgi:hypothetical protein
MPKSKHRRKPGSKAVAHPGRGKPGRPLQEWLDDLSPDENAAPDVAGLPLFDWAGETQGASDRHPTDTEDAEQHERGSGEISGLRRLLP